MTHDFGLHTIGHSNLPGERFLAPNTLRLALHNTRDIEAARATRKDVTRLALKRLRMNAPRTCRLADWVVESDPIVGVLASGLQRDETWVPRARSRDHDGRRVMVKRLQKSFMPWSINCGSRPR